MTVKALIEKLQTLDPGTKVLEDRAGELRELWSDDIYVDNRTVDLADGGQVSGLTVIFRSWG